MTDKPYIDIQSNKGDTPLIAIENVSYAYPHSATSEQPLALDHVSLRIKAGEYVALLGHNGSGKSTLARLINGLLQPTSGRVLVAGLDTRSAKDRKRIRDLVGMIFSDPDNQIIATVVEDDVAWGLAARGYPRAEISMRVDAALAAVGLTDDMRARPPHELSGGQRQRLAIAGVLALEPACVIADEPTALLDPLSRREMVALLRDINRQRGLTIIHVTHLLEEAAQADRVVVLDGGRVALAGNPRFVFSNFDRLRTLRLVTPELAALGEQLRAAGIPIPSDALTPEAFVTALTGQETRQ